MSCLQLGRTYSDAPAFSTLVFNPYDRILVTFVQTALNSNLMAKKLYDACVNAGVNTCSYAPRDVMQVLFTVRLKEKYQHPSYIINFCVGDAGAGLRSDITINIDRFPSYKQLVFTTNEVFKAILKMDANFLKAEISKTEDQEREQVRVSVDKSFIDANTVFDAKENEGDTSILFI